MSEKHDGAAQKSAHTPGPWVMKRDEPFNGYATIYAEGRDLLVVKPWAATCEADGALAASAPDLFAALEAIVYYHDEGMHEVAQGHLMNARAALAKARGEAPQS